MKRRDFFQQFMLGSGGIILTPSIMAQAAQRKAKSLPFYIQMTPTLTLTLFLIIIQSFLEWEALQKGLKL